MKLLELMPYLVHPEKLNELFTKEGLNGDSDALLIYMKGSLDLESQLVIFELEKIEGDLIFEKDGVRYIHFFSIDDAVEFIESDVQNKNNSDFTKAKRLIEYRINDALANRSISYLWS
jgi:hypothetical protein